MTRRVTLDLMDHRIVSGTLETGKGGIELENSMVASRASAGGGCNLGLIVPGTLLIFVPLLLLKAK